MVIRNKGELLDRLEKYVFQTSAKGITEASDFELNKSLAYLIKEEIGKNFNRRNKLYSEKKVKEVFYFSMEFLTGRFMKKNLIYLDLYDTIDELFDDMNRSLEDIIDVEKDPALGNGGLGRLAVAFLDSLASLSMPGHGYGLRYEKGLFKQEIENDRQVELPDNWIDGENVWEYKREEEALEVRIGGFVNISGSGTDLEFDHVDYNKIKAIPYDIPYLGYKNNVANYLRLWSASSYEDIDFKEFSYGKFDQAFSKIINAEIITKFLYPDDTSYEGRRLRLIQEYFLVSASVQDLIRKHLEAGLDLEEFYLYKSIHINDSHPVLAIPEFMRILIDEYNYSWAKTWEITQKTFAFTNHTILSEAMEKWDLNMFKSVLPRIWLIIEEINYRFMYFLENKKQIQDKAVLGELSIVGPNEVRMVNLAIATSFSVNGVSELHTNILKEKTLNNFYKVFPEKFNNKTNGIVHRRWLLAANPKLTKLIKNTIGDGFIQNPLELEKLLDYRDDKNLLENLYKVKHYNKDKLAKIIYQEKGIKINPYSIYDIHIKRIHEYKRQFLNILHIMYLYEKLRDNPNLDMMPRTFIFGGKAAPGYYVAKEVIRLINVVANVVNNDITIKDKIKIIFMENYNISSAEVLIPAADVSEQISTTTKEASGTGNMKFMMNGAITLGTLDGANVEIAKEVGEDNIIIFGLKSNEVYDFYDKGNYNSLDIYNSDLEIKKVVDKLISGGKVTGNQIFPELYDLLTKYNDSYFILEDFSSYVMGHNKINSLYNDFYKWNKMSLTNIGKSGIFSSDNTIRKYAKEIWNIEEVRNGL